MGHCYIRHIHDFMQVPGIAIPDTHLGTMSRNRLGVHKKSDNNCISPVPLLDELIPTLQMITSTMDKEVLIPLTATWVDVQLLNAESKPPSDLQDQCRL
jgi:hypothetical protein